MTDFPRRVNFVDGQILTAADFRMEQEYHRSMRYLNNRLHGYGVVDGLQVSTGDGAILISPGVAIDAHGRELVLAEPRCLQLEQRSDQRERVIMVVWSEAPGRTVPGADGEELVTFWIERPAAMVVAPGKKPPDGVLLARLVLTEEGEPTIDHSVCRRHPLSEQSGP